MTKDEKIEIERKVMTKFMNYFKDNRLDFNDTQLLQRMQESIARIFQLEVEEMGYNYSPSENNVKNTIELNFVNDVDAVDSLFTNGIVSMFADACKVVSIIAIIFVKSVGLGIIIVILTP